MIETNRPADAGHDAHRGGLRPVGGRAAVPSQAPSGAVPSQSGSRPAVRLRESGRPAVPIPADHVARLIATAARAPSVHNTQPWRFLARECAIELHADPSRRLHGDIGGREMLISCGGALFGLRLAVRELGYRPVVDLLPEPAQPFLLARVSLGEEAPITAEERQMLTAVPHRHTHRGPFRAGPLPTGLLARLQHDALAEGAALALVDKPGSYQQLAALVAAARRRSAVDPIARAEARRWSHNADSAARDGIPAEAFPGVGASGAGASGAGASGAGASGAGASGAGASGAGASGAGASGAGASGAGASGAGASGAGASGAATSGARASGAAAPQPGRLPQRDFDLGRGIGLLPGGGAPPLATAVLITAGDQPADWLHAGQAMHRLLIRAAIEWVFASLYTEPLEIPAFRALIRSRLALPGEAQMLLQLGLSGSTQPTARRPVGDVLMHRRPRPARRRGTTEV
jgi:Nitroreductase family